MAIIPDLIGVKIDARQAEVLGGNVVTLAGATTAQATGATILAPNTFARGTTAGGATAFTFSSGIPLGTPYFFTNTSSTTALVYPPLGGAFNGGSDNAAISVPQNTSVLFLRETATAWVAIVTAAGAGSFNSLTVSGAAATGALTVTGAISATGAETILSATAVPAGGTAGGGYKFSSTANLGVFFGSGVPTLSAAKGSLYLRTDGSTTNDRAYINTNGTTTWTALTTAA